jgi:hypothetical protein
MVDEPAFPGCVLSCRPTAVRFPFAVNAAMIDLRVRKPAASYPKGKASRDSVVFVQESSQSPNSRHDGVTFTRPSFTQHVEDRVGGNDWVLLLQEFSYFI